jgi:hypothetical protein
MQTNCINVSVSSPPLCVCLAPHRGAQTIFSLLRLSQDDNKNFSCCFLDRSCCRSHGNYLLAVYMIMFI